MRDNAGMLKMGLVVTDSQCPFVHLLRRSCDCACQQVVATLTEGQQGLRLEHSRPKAAAAALQPAARQVLVSADGCRAALVAPGQVHIFDLQALAYVGRLPGFEVGASSPARKLVRRPKAMHAPQ